VRCGNDIVLQCYKILLIQMPQFDSVSSTWKYALLGGLASLPFTAVSYWQTGSELSLSPVIFGGLLAGYFAKRKTGTGSGVGFRAGLIGALPAIWILFDILGATVGLSGPLWFRAVGTILTASMGVLFVLLGFGFAGIIGGIGGRIGSWIAGFIGQHRPPSTSG
jgi:hypothetical protein